MVSMRMNFLILTLSVTASIGRGQICTANDRAGEDNPQFRGFFTSNIFEQVIMLHNVYKFDCCGILDRWELFTDVGFGYRAHALILHIWRPSGINHVLMWDYPVFVQDESLRVVSIPPSLSFTVKSGDVIGWYTEFGTVKYGGFDRNIYSTTRTRPPVGTRVFTFLTANRRYAINAVLKANTRPRLVNLPASATYSKGVLSAGTVLLAVSATDSDPIHVSSLSYSATGDAALTFNGRAIAVNGVPAVGTHRLTVTITDECGATASGTFTLIITNVNSAPVITSLPTSVDVSEDNAADLDIHTLTTSDADGDTVTCSYTGPYSADFQLAGTNPQTVQLKGTAALNYDTRNHYVVTISCTDATDTVTSDLDVYVVANYAPVISNLQGTASIASTAAVNSNVFTVTSSDGEGDAVTYSHYCADTSCPFNLDSATGELTLSQSLRATDKGAYAVYVTACDMRRCSEAGILTVYVTDLQTRPSIVNLPRTVFVYKNMGNGLVIYNISTFDKDGDTTFTFAMTSDPTTTKFSINNACKCISIPAGETFDSETNVTSYNLTVTASDAYYTSTAKTLTVHILDVNEPPVLTTPSYDITHAEAPAGTPLPRPAYAFTDPDAGDSHTFWLAGGVNSSIISIDSATGRPSFAIDYDYDTNALGKTPQFLVEIRDSGGLTTTATVTLSVTDVNDNAPDCGESHYVTSVDKDASVGTTVFSHSATDADSGSNAAITYSIDHANGVAGTSAAVFDVLSRGDVYVASSLSYLTVSDVNVTVTATDGGSPPLSCSYKLTVRLVRRTRGFLDLQRNLAWFVPLLLLLALTAAAAIFFLCRHGCKDACAPSSAGKWTPPAKHTIRPSPPRNSNAPRPREDYMEELRDTRRSVPRRAVTPTEVRVTPLAPAWESWDSKF